MNASSSGTVQIGSPSKQTPSIATPLTIDSTYFTTQLPSGFHEKRRSETPSASDTLLHLLASGGQNGTQDVAITVGKLPAGGITEVGDYNLRRTQPEVYEMFNPGNLPTGAVAFRSKSGAPGFVVLWPGNTHYTELSFSGDGTTPQELHTTYLQVIQNWRDK
jgi:hypothetical protein